MSISIDSLSKSNILVVDDVQENLNVLTRILKLKGYGVRSVLSGKQALETIRHNKPDLILLDITMPEMTGFEVCEVLKKMILSIKRSRLYL